MRIKLLGLGAGLAFITLGVVALPGAVASAATTTGNTAAGPCYPACPPTAPQSGVTVTTPAPQVTVAPAVKTAPAAAPTQAPTSGGLPFTGADISEMAAVGAGALVLGGVLVRRSRRNASSAA
jgi:hypothetical protein